MQNIKIAFSYFEYILHDGNIQKRNWLTLTSYISGR